MSPVRRICAEPGCNQLVTRGRCPQHLKPPSPMKQAHWTPMHRSIRRALLIPGAVCAICGTNHDLTVDYITPLAHGGKMSLSNARVLCRSHNSSLGATVRT